MTMVYDMLIIFVIAIIYLVFDTFLERLIYRHKYNKKHKK